VTRQTPRPQPRWHQPVVSVAQTQLATFSITPHPQHPALCQRHRVQTPGGHKYDLAPSKLLPAQPCRRQPVLLVLVAQAAVQSISPGEHVARRRRHHAVIITGGCRDDAGSPKVSRVHPRKKVLDCLVAVAEFTASVTAARPDASPARQRYRVLPAAGPEHDGRAPKRLLPQPRR
jgi:hypothetical protein